mmetsp:Transcript_16781/g.25856  ORF Transcript_16781/g.25856 Transcript_16781/m.25856 type:complete len:169 (+) Transcript_16781:807-1313(+)
MFEPVLIWGLLMTSVLTAGYFNLLYFAFGLYLLFAMTRRYVYDVPGARSTNMKEARRSVLWGKTKIILLLTTSIVIITVLKLIMMFHGTVPSTLAATDIEKQNKLERLGFVYASDSEQVLKLTKARSLMAEIDAFVIVCGFAIYYRMIWHAIVDFNKWEIKKEKTQAY